MAPSKENNTLTGSGGQKTFFIQSGSTTTITDFGGVGPGVNPSAAVIAGVDTLKFEGADLTAQTMELRQEGKDLSIDFSTEDTFNTQVILKDFDLEDLENLSKSTGASVNIGNIIFDGQTKVQDSFDVINANQNPNQVFNPNTVTFLNDLDNETQGLDDSNDVINGRDGSDSLRGGGGNDNLDGGSGSDTLYGGDGNDILLNDGNGGDTLYGGDGNDTLYAGSNRSSSLAGTLYGGDGDDTYIFGGYGTGVAIEAANSGTDTVKSIISYTLGSNLENLTISDEFYGGIDANGTGNSLNNTIIGDVSNNVLKGEAGNDILKGEAGNDTLFGSSGAIREIDTLTGGAGRDTFTLGSATEVFYDDSNQATVGTGDYALITDLKTSEDFIKLNGPRSDYFLASSPGALPSGTAIYRNKPSGEPDELIGIVQGSSDLSLDGGYFKFTANEINLADLDGSNGFVLQGIDESDFSGTSVSNAGDVNGDSFDDLVIGAPNGQSLVGESYVVFGKAGNFDASLSLADLNGSNGFVINGIDDDDRSGTSVSTAGDVNGDGFNDLIIGDSGRSYTQDITGESYVVFGKAEAFGASLDLADLNGSNGFVIKGIDKYGGISVSNAGDINGDGFDDVLIGADGAGPKDKDGYNAAGESYVIFGKAGDFSASLDLADLNGSNGFVINAINEGDNLGNSVGTAGDVNGDGFDDLLIGASGADSFAGESYVIFGKAGDFSASLDPADLNGSNGFEIKGTDRYGGISISSAGDVNSDGFDDVLIGAGGATSNGQDGAGKSYVVFGHAEGFGASLNLADLDGSNGFVLKGIDGIDNSGSSVSNAGDVNGDGFDDVLIGAGGATSNGQDGAGESYVVFGKAGGGFGASLNLADLNGSNGFVIKGIDEFDRSGTSVSNAGDVDGDGFDDLLIGASGAGESYVLFGRDFTGQVNRPGTSGNDTLTGTSGGDVLIGGLGNDILLGQAGSDVLKGSGGDDILGFDPADRRLEGDAGTDTLQVDGGSVTLDLTAIANNKITDIEQIDLTGTGNNSLTFNRLELLDLSDTTNQLTVQGNTGDAVSSTGQSWVFDSTATLGNTLYNRYTVGAATLLVDADISQTLT